MRILIVRHGDPDYAHDSLTEAGRREAALLGERLARIPARAYYVSPLGRARETAEYTLRLVGREAEVLPWLAEFRGYGVDANGQRHLVWDFRTTAWYDHPLLFARDRWVEDPLVAGGNTAEIWAETKAGTDALLLRHGYRRQGGIYRCEENQDNTIVLFCHFAIGTAVMAYLLGIPPVPLWQSFQCLPTAVTTLVTQERSKGEIEFRCVNLGDLSHLLQGGEPLSLSGLFPECYNGVESTDPSRWPTMPEKPLLR